MSIIDKAVNDGIAAGFREAAFERCHGRDDPESRCPMQIGKQACVCAYVQWERLPWYRRMFINQPQKPTNDDSLSCCVKSAIEEML